jgi:hypothetical protein
VIDATPNLEAVFWGRRREEVGRYIIRRVMMTFCMVRKRFSPYVENGNSFRKEYASVIA